MPVNHFDTPVMIDGLDTDGANAANFFCFGVGSPEITQPTGPIIWGLSSDVAPTDTVNAGSLCLQQTSGGAGFLYLSQGGSGWDAVLTSGSAVTGVQATAPLIANGTRTVPMFFPAGGTITNLRVITPVALSSAAGTITLAIQLPDGTTLLSTATVDAEAFVANTLTALTLTGTPANLIIGAGGHINIVLTSNNADAVGGDLLVQADFS